MSTTKTNCAVQVRLVGLGNARCSDEEIREATDRLEQRLGEFAACDVRIGRHCPQGREPAQYWVSLWARPAREGIEPVIARGVHPDLAAAVDGALASLRAAPRHADPKSDEAIPGHVVNVRRDAHAICVRTEDGENIELVTESPGADADLSELHVGDRVWWRPFRQEGSEEGVLANIRRRVGRRLLLRRSA